MSSSAFSKGVTALPQLPLLLLLATGKSVFSDTLSPRPPLISLELAELLKLDPFMGTYKRGFHKQAGDSGRHSCCSVEVADSTLKCLHTPKFTLLCCPLI